MRILHAFNEQASANKFTFELTNAIRAQNVQLVDEGLANFWDCKVHYDIVHIHWPEALFKAKTPTDEELQSLARVLDHWKSDGSNIIVTRHNILPHYKTSPQFEKLYEIVFGNAEAVVHLGDFSRQEYLERYRDFPQLAHQKHVVIPHGIYTDYPNTVSPEKAREALDISKKQFVILAFGKLRSYEETSFLKKVIKNLPVARKLLLVPRWKYKTYGIRNRIERLYYDMHPHFRLESNLVENERVQLYMNAADILILPRFHNLNSGSLVLGFSFGKVVVGADYGVVGEILKTTGNPVFQPDSMESIIQAILRGKTLNEQGIGVENMQYAQQHWNWDKIAQKHIHLYQELSNKI